jgi:hypothetical protein
MLSLPIVVVACVLALASSVPQAAPGQAPGERERPGPVVRPTPTPGGKKEIARQTKEMQGVWRMVELRSPILKPARRSEMAYLLVTEEYLSFELHMDWPDEQNLVQLRYFESGTYHYEVLEGARLEMRVLIACFTDPAGLTQFLPPGFVKRYQMVIEGDRMSWTGPDGRRVVFERLVATRTKRDIFGRTLPEEKPAEDATKKESDPKAPGKKDEGRDG